ncbi:Asp-tRNA(Asn)/Glu-tRNA(Gln) amidotransferase GatCAB subunit B [Candidatus Roizmanbacteria bacterium CG_4_10_14_0_8_um_filter_39_9]|uniref:Aspartyl/glutamyl-tRNA(Asn/Gln) amidotransferase subunit B n=1 Tax=Candidatus Roizmanbacteria bacterium CG_4_10_14_0_8_um_filter_39_9 TaxID=1974829 RepID=A0A2M7QDM4_9BACT|nr:MAG: Asp-tRNA(Asn)/Glu-tRNA(Gln) amidotransferase GatCAB subunit B [Candidatus Roizmanbacteria bacterium CG_4_10_14_0_8_um_filter_39_9]
MKQYKPVIGLEIHVELKTKTGMFCQCRVNQFDALPNTQVCPVCLGMPGALPVPNRQAIEWTIKIGHALNCKINKHTKFDRKHYSYPDLPKGYQISQYDEPIAVKGHLDFEANYGTNKNEKKSFRIHRVHLEEDTGKLTHQGDDTLIDFNRSGTPLVEMVTEADFESSDDVKMFLEELHTIIRALDVSDADMERGTMRMEPNISVREILNTKPETLNKPQITNFKLPNYKVEVKNINSFNFVKRAIEFEIKRHIELLEKGETPIQETRGWDSQHNRTYSQRTKEEAHDYRYFPEPDIPPFEFSDEYIESIKKTLPELPRAKMYRYIEVFKLRPMDAFNLSRDKELSAYFEEAMSKVKNQSSKIKVQSEKIGQEVANFIMNKKISIDLSVGEFADEAIELMNPVETDTNLLDTTITKLITANPKVVADYRGGKQNSIMFFVGQVMREMKGKADAKTVIEELKKELA